MFAATISAMLMGFSSTHHAVRGVRRVPISIGMTHRLQPNNFGPLVHFSATTLPLATLIAPLRAAAEEPSFSMNALLASDEMRQLGVFFAQTLITWGVPAVVFLFIALVASLKSDRPPLGDAPDDCHAVIVSSANTTSLSLARVC